MKSNTIPKILKSVSGKHVPLNPTCCIIGYTNIGPTAIKIPVTKEPMIQPFNPPVALPKTPAVAPIKKYGIATGIMTVVPVIAIIIIQIKPAI